MNVPFSLHCTICFEAFDLTERPPVVLPCGHTYLCQPCSKRLKVCMECRTPLFLHPKAAPAPAAAGHAQTTALSSPVPRGGGIRAATAPTHSGRAHSRTGNASPPSRLDPEPLPVPKNLVLMAMLESLQLENKKPVIDDDKMYESGDDDEEVKEGLKLMNAFHGTYVVRDPDGLFVFAEPPCEADLSNKENQSSKGQEENSVNDSDVPFAVSTDDEQDVDEKQPNQSLDRKSAPVIEPLLLSYGQTVQVATFSGGIAKLARGKGYILAGPDQLVKIGQPKDEACKIEGTLAAVSERRDKIKKMLNEMDEMMIKLNSDLTAANSVPYDDPFEMLPVVLEPGEKLIPPITPNTSAEKSSTRMHATPTTTPDQEGVGLSSSLLELPNLASLIGLGSNESPAVSHRAHAPASPGGTPGGGVNFRTGLSGHLALTSSSSHADRYDHSRRGIRMMSEHRGISKIKPIRRGSTPDAPPSPWNGEN